jgi:hemoglobin/transferrin/lactoferrin receptor protein
MDFGLRAAATKHRGQARVDFGIDLNGRFDLEAQDVTIDYDAQGAVAQRDDFTTIENARRLDAGVYLSADGAVSASVSLAGGLRFDRVCSTNEGGYFGDLGVCRSEPSGFAAVTLGPFAAFSTSLQYSRGFRDARLSDRFFRGVTGAGFITGNPDLDAETSDQYDLALRYGKARWHVAVYFYDYRIDDLIERYEEPPASDDFFFRNRGRARIRGAEVELQAELPAAVSLQVAAGTTDGESLDDGAPLDDIPPGNLRIQARKAIGERGWVQLRGAWTGKLDEPGPTEVTLDSYVVLDASAGWRLGAVELQLLVRNVLDETYLLTADRRSPPAPGTSALLSAFVTF